MNVKLLAAIPVVLIGVAGCASPPGHDAQAAAAPTTCTAARDFANRGPVESIAVQTNFQNFLVTGTYVLSHRPTITNLERG